MSGYQLWVFIALCIVGAGASSAFLWLLRGQGTSAWIDQFDTASGRDRRRRRRYFGMALMALISLATLIGTVVLEPLPHAVSFVAYWAGVVALVFWLCCIATADMVHTMIVQARRAAQRTHRRSAALDELRARLQRGDNR